MAGVKKENRISPEERKAKKKAYMAVYRAKNKEQIATQKAEYDKAYREKNKEKIRAKQYEYKSARRKELAQKSKEWQEKNPERYRQRLKEYYKENREKILRYQQQYAQDNKESVGKRKKAWISSKPGLVRIYSHNRRAKTRANGGTLSKDLAERLYGRQKGKCRCCGKPLGKDYHIDHIIPIVQGGANTDENCQLLRKTCNLKKGAKDPYRYAQEMGKLFL